MFYGSPPELDDKDREIIAERMTAFNQAPGYRVGDYVEFADGITRRISYIWDWEGETPGVQTSNGGSWHLGNGYVSFSGSLFVCVPGDTLTDTGKMRKGHVWIEHHGFLTAGCDVHSEEDFRVFSCSREAPKY